MNSSPSFIPFFAGKEHCKLIAEYFGDAPLARVGLHDLPKLNDCLPAVRLWIDSGIDGIGGERSKPKSPNADRVQQNRQQAWEKTITSFPGHSSIGDPVF